MAGFDVGSGCLLPCLPGCRCTFCGCRKSAALSSRLPAKAQLDLLSRQVRFTLDKENALVAAESASAFTDARREYEAFQRCQ